jgi:hypothetical protein
LAPALATIVLVFTFRDVNGSYVGTLLSAAGVLALPIVVAPQLLALASETWGWWHSFSVLGLLVLSQALFLTLVFIAAFSELSRASRALIGVPGLQYVPALAALVLGAVSLGASFALHKGAVVGRSFELLSRIPSTKLRA